MSAGFFFRAKDCHTQPVLLSFFSARVSCYFFASLDRLEGEVIVPKFFHVFQLHIKLVVMGLFFFDQRFKDLFGPDRI